MKITLVMFCFMICFGQARAQRFFYVDGDRVAGSLVRASLLNSSQFITVSSLSSDYIVKAEIHFQPGRRMLSLQIHLQDTATLKTVFQDKETLAFGELHTDSRLILQTVIRAFIDKNISHIIFLAGENHFDESHLWISDKKDKI